MNWEHIKLHYTQKFLTVWCADQTLLPFGNAVQYCDDKQQLWRHSSMNVYHYNRGWVIMPVVLSLGTDFRCWLVPVPTGDISYSNMSHVFIGVNVRMFFWWLVNKHCQYYIHSQKDFSLQCSNDSSFTYVVFHICVCMPVCIYICVV